MTVLLQNSSNVFQSSTMKTITNIQGHFTNGTTHLTVDGTSVTMNGHSLDIHKNVNTIGGSFWLSSIALLLFIEENKELFHQKRVLELGAGIGLPSMFIAKACNPASVVATDMEDVTLALNIIGNRLQDKISIVLLDWDALDDLDDLDDYDDANKFDVIIASDCIYRENQGSFMKAVKRFLAPNRKLVVFNAERDGLDECIYALQEMSNDLEIETVSLKYNGEYETKIVRLLGTRP